jgi:hypothetical protein
MASQPAYAATPIVDQSFGSTANTAFDGTGTLVTGATGTASGKRITRVRVSKAVTSAAGLVNFFYSPDGGTTKKYLTSIAISAITASSTVAPFEGFVADLVGFELVSTNAILYWSTSIAEATNVHIESAGL